MRKTLFIIALSLLFGVCASAQPLKVQEKTYEKFSKISAEDNFVLKFYHSETYSVTLKSDERIAAHVQAYVKNGTLYLILDEKGYSPELKKQLRQKGAAAPVLEAEVYMPTYSSLVITDKCVLSHSDDFATETFVLTASDHAVVSELNIACSTAEFNVSKNAQVKSTAYVNGKLYLNASNSTQVTLTQEGGNALVSVGNSAFVDLKASVNTLEVEVASSSESHFSGTASFIKVLASNLSKVDAELIEAQEGDIMLSGSAKCYVNVTEKLKVNLTGGSMLTFKRTPIFEIDRIVNSTLIKADDARRK